ncbi:FG-GAP repeat protein [Desulfatibacillum aliphaticivorans]|uniref:FG-GAP repeat protein n=1 Tax=Desulfatibacillum aliphaticivorans TaxID=218208 RepID=B8FFY5_DESAL|nr:FG-GAP-like repeat-containing protein [Desulfatibacillum aliphaticivorans]ACL03540.1 FG-GAP repeat protein [Desulfatibacillum aliphaticivorans]
MFRAWRFQLAAAFLILFSQTAFAAFSPPDQDYALRFSGYQIARAPLVPELDLGEEFTMEVWVYLEGCQDYTVVMGKPHTDRGTDPWMSYVIGLTGNRNFEFIQTTGSAGTYRSVTAPDPAPLNEWVHAAAVLSDGTMKLYVNGQMVNSMPSPGTPNVNSIPFSLGAGASLAGTIAAGGFSGALCQARVWDKALTAQEIQTHASQALAGNEVGLIVCWPLDDGQGGTARSVGNLNADLTLGDSGFANAPEWVTMEFLEILSDPAFVGNDFELTTLTPFTSPQDAIPIDFDGDGDLDLIVTALKWNSTDSIPLVIMENKGQGILEAVADEWAGGIAFTHPRAWAKADFNKDNRMDFVIGDHGYDAHPFPGGVSKIILQTDSGTLAEESAARFPATAAFTHDIAAGDINGDAYPDVYLCNIAGQNNVGPRFCMNSESGVFTEDTTRLPAEVTNLTKRAPGCALVDVDKDGDLDLVLGGHQDDGYTRDALLLNNGSGYFSYAAANAMPARPLGVDNNTISVCPADFNNDGWPDLLMASTDNYQTPILYLLLNNQDGTFRDASDGLPQDWPTSPNYGDCWVRWTLPADFNSDGWLDFLAVGQNSCPTKMYLNKGGAEFRDASNLVPLGTSPGVCAVGDFTGDGRPDIAVIRADRSASLYENTRDLFNIQGDVNRDGEKNMADLILSLKVMIGNTADENGYKWADVSEDGRLGLSETVYLMRLLAGE